MKITTALLVIGFTTIDLPGATPTATAEQAGAEFETPAIPANSPETWLTIQ